MKFSHSWLLKYLKTDLTPAEIAERLTSSGIEVESVIDQAEALKGFVYAKVIAREKHPNADRLSVCTVDIGANEPIQVVCGAPNVAVGMGVAFAKVGAIIPSTGEVLKKGKIRDAESFGMLCSARELALGVEGDGIMDLGAGHAPGTALDKIIEVDAIYDVSITPDRGDCFSVYGIARDLAIIDAGELRPFLGASVTETEVSGISVKIKTGLCAKFAVRRIEEVVNTDSPLATRKLLEAAGQKPIDALVDATNYSCIGLGRPTHVFDADKVLGDLVVREAVAGERFLALNEKEYALDEGMIVVADDSGVISLAGIMGGQKTAVSATTRNVLLESAVFDPIAIAKAGQKLNLVSDSRTRFERGVDPSLIEPCLDLVTAMIVEVCGGKICRAVVETGAAPAKKTIDFDFALARRRLGLEIGDDEIERVLTKSGCGLEKRDGFYSVTPPSWRHDFEIAEDLVEEIARIAGYDRVEPLALPLKPRVVADVLGFYPRRHMANRGFLEAVTWSFIDAKSAENFTSDRASLLTLANPISEELNTMRPSLVAGLLKIAAKNAARARPNGALFELAPVYAKEYKDFQTLMLAGLRFGANHARHWESARRSVDVFDAKNDALSALEALNVPESATRISAEAPAYYHPGRKGSVKQGQKTLACFGEIHPSLGFDFKAVGFEIFLENLAPVKPKKIRKTFSDLMAVRRDFAFVLDAATTAAVLLKAIEKSTPLIETAEVFDIYQGANVGEGKKSLAISVVLQPLDKTLSEDELTAIHETIIANAAKVGAVLRG